MPGSTDEPTADTLALLDRFFAAIEAGDGDAIGACYSDDVEVWHNVTQRSLDKGASLELLRFWCDRVAERRYEVLLREAYPGGAVQRHVVHGTVDGEPMAAHVAIVFGIDGDRITSIHEYLDPAAVAAVFG